MSDTSTRNIALYPWYAAFHRAYFWLPIFFLFFNEHLSLGQVLRLEAIYYFAVVLLEVPSGYFSDRVGRKPTLLISAMALTASYGLFAIGSGFAVFAAAQVLLAIGVAFNSGTDVSFHHDALAESGREGEFGDREARIGRMALLVGAAAALLGGAVGVFSLRLAYVLSACGALASVGVVLAMREPGSHETATPHGRGFFAQLGSCAAYLRSPLLAWLFALGVLIIVLKHVPYEFYQPFVGLLGEDWSLFSSKTPLFTGVMAAGASLIAAQAAGMSIRLRNRFGLGAVILGGLGLQTLIIAAMGFVLHPLVLIVVVLWSTPRALLNAPVNAAVAPRVDRAHRATYLSIQSLLGRLAFSGWLIVLAGLGGEIAEPTWGVLSNLLLVSAALSLGGLVVLAVTARWALRTERDPD